MVCSIAVTLTQFGWQKVLGAPGVNHGRRYPMV